MPQPSEGVVKFTCRFSAGQPLPVDGLREINAWRRVLYLLGLIGQDPALYDGFGYGNISVRWRGREGEDAFVISGTQTGGLEGLGAQHYTLVRKCDPHRNLVEAEGPIRPSSESLTHGTLYRLERDVGCVMHAHSHLMWRHARNLQLTMTDPDVPYGTPEMAREVERIWRGTDVAQRGIFAMGGHEDGIVAFGPTVERAGSTLVATFAAALQLEESP